MSNIEIISKIDALKEWEQLAAEAAAEIESLKDAIKREMECRGNDYHDGFAHAQTFYPCSNYQQG